MLMMRLQRIGRRNEAHFKIVVIEKTKGPKSHKYVDILGSYNPKIGTVTLDEVAAKEWLAKGVQPSDTVFNMLVTKGLVEGRKKNVLPKKSPTKKRNAPDEEPEKEVPVEETPVDVAEEDTTETPDTPAEESKPEPETKSDEVVEETPATPEEVVETPETEEVTEKTEE